MYSFHTEIVRQRKILPVDLFGLVKNRSLSDEPGHSSRQVARDEPGHSSRQVTHDDP